MTILLLIICAAGFGFLGVKQFQKNLAEVKEKNLSEKNPFSKGWNYFTGLLWASYILVFSLGLIVNNLIIN